MPHNIEKILAESKIIPITVFENSDDALKMAELLMNNSVNILEITLRSDRAYQSLNAVSKRFPELVLGAGSILSRESLKKAMDSGAKFAVAPSLDPEIVDYAKKLNIPFIPGVTTPTELHMALKESNIIKIFPAAPIGGTGYIKSIIAPFALKNFSLIPTGGINEKTYLDYFSIDKVIALGMSYVADKNLIKNGDFDSLDNRIKQVYSGLHQLLKL